MTEEVKAMKVKVWPLVAWFVLGLIIGGGVIYAMNLRSAANNPQQLQQAQAQAQVKDLLDKVGKLIMLPTGEEPVVATINDAVSLARDQVFYKGSKNGDVVLVYEKAGKAIVYSPDRNLVVNVGPIFLQNQQAQTPIATTTKK